MKTFADLRIDAMVVPLDDLLKILARHHYLPPDLLKGDVRPIGVRTTDNPSEFTILFEGDDLPEMARYRGHVPYSYGLDACTRYDPQGDPLRGMDPSEMPKNLADLSPAVMHLQSEWVEASTDERLDFLRWSIGLDLISRKVKINVETMKADAPDAERGPPYPQDYDLPTPAPSTL